MERKIMARLFAWKDRAGRKPLLLQGARQVGKTFVLREFGSRAFPNCHYFDLEEQRETFTGIFSGATLAPAAIVEKLSFLGGRPIRPGEDLLILDEIQAVPRALTALKYFCQDMPELAVAAAGSNLGVAMGETPFPVGKVESLTLYPLDFEEFLSGTGEEAASAFLKNFAGGDMDSFYHQALFELLKTYFVVGGLPEVVARYAAAKERRIEAFAEVRRLQKQLLFHYRSDFSKYTGSTNSRHIERVFDAIPAQLSKTQEKRARKFRFKDVISKGYRRYEDLADPIDWLRKAGLALKLPVVRHVLPPLAANVVDNSFRLYLFDVGLLGAMNGLAPETIMLYDYGSYKGYFAENFVLQELTAHGFDQVVSWMGRTSEIEFVVEVEEGIVPVEVKAGINTKAKSLQVFRQKYKPPFSVTCSGAPYAYHAVRRQYDYPLYLLCRFPELSRTGD